MTRAELIKSDEWVIAHIESFVVSKNKITDIRKKLTEFFISYRDELLNLKKEENEHTNSKTND